jgi:hypothetical protein
MPSTTRITITCATCGKVSKVIQHGHVASYTGVDIEHIQVHHVLCRQERTRRGRAWSLRREVSATVRNVTRYALARIGLTF